MAIDEKTVRHVAKLAKLEFKENEIQKFTEQLDGIIEMVEQLEDLEAEGVPGTYHGIINDTVLREDVAEEGTDREELFKNVKSQKNGYIEVPAIIDNGESGA